jgi:hypothetical protein
MVPENIFNNLAVGGTFASTIELAKTVDDSRVYLLNERNKILIWSGNFDKNGFDIKKIVFKDIAFMGLFTLADWHL